MKKLFSLAALFLLIVVLAWSYYVFAHDMHHAGRIMLEILALAAVIRIAAYGVKVRLNACLCKPSLTREEHRRCLKTARAMIETLYHLALALLLNALAIGFAGLCTRMIG